MSTRFVPSRRGIKFAGAAYPDNTKRWLKRRACTCHVSDQALGARHSCCPCGGTAPNGQTKGTANSPQQPPGLYECTVYVAV